MPPTFRGRPPGAVQVTVRSPYTDWLPVRRISSAEAGRAAKRPAYSVLRTEKDAPVLPHWRDGLRACLERLGEV